MASPFNKDGENAGDSGAPRSGRADPTTILVVDYALTQKYKTVEQRFGECDWYDQLSPLPALRNHANHICTNPPISRAPINVTPTAGSEFWGCFIGGLLLSTFADHPCAPITVTRYNQQNLLDNNVDAAFFEWLLTTQSGGQLRASGNTVAPTWHGIVTRGLPVFRERLQTLAANNSVKISLDDLLSLANDPLHPILTISSKYGTRRYPVAGLFLDGTQTPDAWAWETLRNAYNSGGEECDSTTFNTTMQQADRGRHLAKDLWVAYSDTSPEADFAKRQRLSELRARAKGQLRYGRPLEKEEEKLLWDLNKRSQTELLTPTELETLRSLHEKTGTEPFDAADWEVFVSLHAHFGIENPFLDAPSCSIKSIDLCHPEYSSDKDKQARRWAVLMVIVRLLHQRWFAMKSARLAAAEVGISYSTPPQFCDLIQHDVYLALFPIPIAPAILPWHGRRIDVAASWSRWLKHINLNIDSILNGVEKGGSTPSERVLLRLYASSLGLRNHDTWDETEWQEDFFCCNVLLN